MSNQEKIILLKAQLESGRISIDTFLSETNAIMWEDIKQLKQAKIKG